MSYEDAPATRMLATHCLICGRPLLDAKSVELGIGPVCRRKVGFDQAVPNRELANKAVHDATIAAQDGDVDTVIMLADKIEQLALPKLAEKIRERFIKIRIEEVETPTGAKAVKVFTPFSMTFVRALHDNVPWNGRDAGGEPVTAKKKITDDHGKFVCWAVREGFKRGLLKALIAAYPGEQALGPKGTFRIPTNAQQEAA